MTNGESLGEVGLNAANVNDVIDNTVLIANCAIVINLCNRIRPNVFEVVLESFAGLDEYLVAHGIIMLPAGAVLAIVVLINN